MNSIWLEHDYSSKRFDSTAIKCRYQMLNISFANHWWRIRGRPTASRINLSANRSAAVKATGNYKSRKRKQRKDELLISPGVILTLDPRCCLWPVRFSVLRSSRDFFLLRSSCRNCDFNLLLKYDFFIVLYEISPLCID